MKMASNLVAGAVELDGLVTHSIKQRPAALAYLAVERRDHNLIWWLASCEPSELKASTCHFSSPL